MSKQTVTVKVEIHFKEGKRTILMELKEPHEIEDCEEGKAVMFNLRNGETYTGIFKGMDGDIMLGSLSGGSTISLKVNWVNDYFEQVGS
ncbi:hypothetical protein FLACOL_01087 [Flavobacterium columnare]|uniref:Uncharacterized protein n=2 Tax=Flavobacterium TaxID=237 RepID=A0ABW8PLC1_9FLAO|nr:hypothetical protein [Flavobacterium columnare]SPE77097.1 hypothetical protein FLACOL_01087 [Flavobacterium columnare]